VNKHCAICAVVLAAILLIASGGFAVPQTGTHPEDSQYHWELPKGFPAPRVPADNPMTAAKARLGRYLFYDKRMSVNGTESCADCHRQELAFTDGKPQGVGATGEVHPRGAMSLVNVGYNAALTWSNPNEHSLENQALTPMFGEHPLELGLTGKGEAFIQVLRTDAAYREMFPAAFPTESDPFNISNVTKAIASFERTIISASSPYDHYHYGGDDQAVSDSAKRGELLFFSEPLSCFRCHNGFNFSDATDFEGKKGSEVPFHNTGLYNIAGALSYPSPNVGIYEYTQRPEDVGKFKAPTLRNIALTAPYMHDGSAKTLGDVLDHYSAGGRTIADGAFAGDGSHNPNKDPLIRGFKLSPQDRADLISFLESLTDHEVIHGQRFADPRASQPRKPGEVLSDYKKPTP
jgi:cytochrome c peroxidase